MTKRKTEEQKERGRKMRRHLKIEAHIMRIRLQVRRALKARKAREAEAEFGNAI